MRIYFTCWLIGSVRRTDGIWVEDLCIEEGIRFHSRANAERWAARKTRELADRPDLKVEGHEIVEMPPRAIKL